MRHRSGWLLALLVLGGLGLAACGGGDGDTTGDGGPPGASPVQVLENQGQVHTLPGESIQDYSARTGFPGYNHIPPASGPHDPQWVRCGVYGDPQRFENLIHSLEHGDVIWYYHPDVIGAETVQRLAGLAETLLQEGNRVILTPSREIQTPLALTAWVHVLPLEQYDAEAIRDFTETYSDKGPERGVPC